MLIVFMPSEIILIAIMLNVVILNVTVLRVITLTKALYNPN
jgi:hypothetical protein